MSQNTKIILAVVGGIVALCLCVGCGLAAASMYGVNLFAQNVEQSFSDDPAQVEAQAGAIAEFDVPAGYSSEGTMDIFGMKMVFYTDQSNDGMIMFMSMPSYMNLSNEEMQSQFQTAMQNQGVGGGNMQLVDTVETTIKGQPATLLISEGDTGEGVASRQMFTSFEGDSGTVFLMVFAPVDNWDQAAIDAFLASIR